MNFKKRMNMKKQKYKILIIGLLAIVGTIQCSGSSSTGIFSSPNQVAVDTQNDRLLVTQRSQQLFTFIASTRTADGGTQPLVSASSNATISNLLPEVVTSMVAFGTGTTSRVFIQGAQFDASGFIRLNLVRVLDFDGSTFSEASFSPIEISDGNDATDERNSTYSRMVLDQANSRIYVLDTTTDRLFVLSTIDGTNVTNPITIAGEPEGLALNNNRLYVCNRSTVAAEQVITVVNGADFSSTAIPLGGTCDKLAVQNNDTGTVAFIRQSSSQRVLIGTIAATFDSFTSLNSSTTGIANGQLTSSAGITSSILELLAGRTSDGTIHAYLGELDGNVQLITVPSTLASFSQQTLSTAVTNLSQGVVFEGSDGVATSVHFVAETGAILTFDFASTIAQVNN